MDIERPPNLRTPGTEPGGTTPPAFGGPTPPINALAELVADLIAATGLVPADKLAMVRGAAGHGLLRQGARGPERRLQRRSRPDALRAPPDSPGRPRADRRDRRGKRQIALHVLERLAAIPYAIDEGTLRVAVADPGNIQGVDELRLATRYPIELGVAARDDIMAEIRRLARASEAFGARAAVEEELELEEEEEEADDLEVDDGISDAPLVRLVNSVIFQAAEDGASDVHFEPQEDATRALPRRRRAQEVQRIPKR